LDPQSLARLAGKRIPSDGCYLWKEGRMKQFYSTGWTVIAGIFLITFLAFGVDVGYFSMETKFIFLFLVAGLEWIIFGIQLLVNKK
jgi:hypothetical protein